MIRFNRRRCFEVKIVRDELWGVAALCLLLSMTPNLIAAAATQTSAPRWTPPTSDPKDFEGVWLPGGYANGPQDAPQHRDDTKSDGPPPELGGLDNATSAPGPDGPPGGGPPGGGPPPAEGVEAASGGTLSCTPVQRLAGAGGGMANLWIQGPNEIVMISEEDMDIRKIYLGTAHPKRFKPQPNGHSVGHWEGNTLVVDSVGFSKPDGSDRGQHVVERIHKDGNKLIDEATITDNGQTRTQTFTSSWRSDLHVYENVCEENFNRFHFENGQLIDDTTGSK